METGAFAPGGSLGDEVEAFSRSHLYFVLNLAVAVLK